MISVEQRGQVRLSGVRPVNSQPSRPGVLTLQEIRIYYRSVLGPERVPDSQTILLLPCIFKPHSDGMTINLRTGYWRCAGGCGEGDIYAFQMKRTQSLIALPGGRPTEAKFSGKPSFAHLIPDHIPAIACEPSSQAAGDFISFQDSL
jgi:hypothetical protein